MVSGESVVIVEKVSQIIKTFFSIFRHLEMYGSFKNFSFEGSLENLKFVFYGNGCENLLWSFYF